MSLQVQLQEDMKTAMKAGDKARLSVIRMLLNEVKNIDLAPKRVSPEEAVAAYGKKLAKSVEEYEKLGKSDEVTKLKGELAVVNEYLPKKLSPEQTEELIEQFLAGQSFTEKQAGQAMGAFLKLHAGQVDPAIVNAAMRRKLAGK
jgi:uncharacterized protein